MNKVLEALIPYLRDVLLRLTPDERVEFFGKLAEGYCRECGWARGDNICHCTNDE